MHIAFVEVQNFRKLKSIRIDFSLETTVFVGSNNSGKTSAMVSLGHFLVDHNRFSTNDFTLSNWDIINTIGKVWEKLSDGDEIPTIKDWVSVLPSIDIWLHVEVNEIQYVKNLIPFLDWQGGLLGVRLRFEPKKVEDLYIEYSKSRRSSIETVSAAKSKKAGAKYTLSLWPKNMSEFLAKKLKNQFIVRSYLLDPEKIANPKNGIAIPQIIDDKADPIEGNPLNGLLRIDEINAQRGFSDSNTNDNDESGERGNKKKLSDQLRLYFSRHIDPTEIPEPSDVDALQAIHDAQSVFDEKLKSSFEIAFEEIGDLGYPGLNDLEIILSTKIHPMDGLNHPSALQYKVGASDTGDDEDPYLPEQYNGLGYQNLISMVFRLMGFRDYWMKVGKAGKKVIEEIDEAYIPPIHLVLVEEPEAHLHVQVQQVFIRKAYKILRNHPDLKEKKDLTTQLIVTTHSSHIAHECEFSWLRYFRRKPALFHKDVPTTTVVNLSEIFGKESETQKFVTRYLETTHCDLFFADAVILVEGAAERILLPHFIRHYHQKLYKSYITILEISGSHAHRLRPLIEHLGLIALIITDIDAAKANENKSLVSVVPKRNDGQISRNSTLRNWIPGLKPLDKLLDLSFDLKIVVIDEFASIRVCYQTPIVIADATGNNIELLPNTFEDSLFYQNISIFLTLKGRTGLLRQFKKMISDGTSFDLYPQIAFDLLKGNVKAEFALNMLYQDVGVITPPSYITEGLGWLEKVLKKKSLDTIIEEVELVVSESSKSVTSSETTTTTE